MNTLLDLFLTFFKIGAFTFGGGYAMIPIIENLCVERKQWISHDEMMNLTVIAESTPGPIAINAATFVGYKCARMAGSAIATLGMVLPSFMIILVISTVLDHFLEYPIVVSALQGIKIAVGLLIVDAALNMIRKMKKELLPRLIMVIAAGVMLATNIFSVNFSTITLLLAAAVVSLVVFCIQDASSKKGGEQQ